MYGFQLNILSDFDEQKFTKKSLVDSKVEAEVLKLRNRKVQQAPIQGFPSSTSDMAEASVCE